MISAANTASDTNWHQARSGFFSTTVQKLWHLRICSTLFTSIASETRKTKQRQLNRLMSTLSLSILPALAKKWFYCSTLNRILKETASSNQWRSNSQSKTSLSDPLILKTYPTSKSGNEPKKRSCYETVTKWFRSSFRIRANSYLQVALAWSLLSIRRKKLKLLLCRTATSHHLKWQTLVCSKDFSMPKKYSSKWWEGTMDRSHSLMIKTQTILPSRMSNESQSNTRK